MVAQALAPDGYVIAGIQQTETPIESKADSADADDAGGAPTATAVVVPHTHAHTHAHGALHDHTGVKGNAYNFASTAQHAASFDLLGGQLSGLQCFRTADHAPLGCVEGAHNWFASLCELGPHVGVSASGGPALANALYEYTAGWPIGGRLAERCAAQRHFLGYADDGATTADGASSAESNVRNPYLLRQLMGFCMFHGCREIALLGGADLAARGAAPRVVGGRNVTLFV